MYLLFACVYLTLRLLSLSNDRDNTAAGRSGERGDRPCPGETRRGGVGQTAHTSRGHAGERTGARGGKNGPGGKPKAPEWGERPSRSLLPFVRPPASRPVAIVHKAHIAPFANNEMIQNVDPHHPQPTSAYKQSASGRIALHFLAEAGVIDGLARVHKLTFKVGQDQLAVTIPLVPLPGKLRQLSDCL